MAGADVRSVQAPDDKRELKGAGAGRQREDLADDLGHQCVNIPALC